MGPKPRILYNYYLGIYTNILGFLVPAEVDGDGGMEPGHYSVERSFLKTLSVLGL